MIEFEDRLRIDEKMADTQNYVHSLVIMASSTVWSNPYISRYRVPVFVDPLPCFLFVLIFVYGRLIIKVKL